MTSPQELSAFQQDLLAELQLVDASRARAEAAEVSLRTEIAAVYAARLGELEKPDTPAGEVLTAAVLASLVLIIRRAFSAGVDEGARFAVEQFEALGIPPQFYASLEFDDPGIADRLVRDFLSGQVAVVKAGKSREEMFTELARRAEIAVVSAVQAGRGWATVTAFEVLAESLGTQIHKLWVARFDLVTPPCALCTRLHGRHVPLGEAFEVPDGEPVPYFSPLKMPPRHPNCRCSLILYLPEAENVDDGVTPLAMQSYATWRMATASSEEEIAATIVRVKSYTRMVNGRLQHVSGYFYHVESGQKIPANMVPQGASTVKTVSAKQAKSMAQVSKKAGKAPAAGKPSKSKWSPGTYKVDLPGDDDTQIIVHKDGSSTAIHKGNTEDADPGQTTRFLSMHDGAGNVTKVSSGTGSKSDIPDLDEKSKKDATLAEGWYLLPDNKNYGGVFVDQDGTGKLFSKDFKKKWPLQEKSVKDISNGHLGEVDEVEEKDFKPDWDAQLEKAQAAGTPNPGSSDSDSEPSPPGEGSGSSAPSTGSDKAPEVEEAPQLPEGGPGVVADAPALFSVGPHMVEVPEGAQVYKSSKSKDTLYVLNPDGDLIKYNPQGAGVQATKVGSSENPAGRAQQLAKLDNVTEDGVSLKNTMPTPGSGKALVGGFEMTSAQLGDAIAALSSNPSGNVAADLKKVGSPLAAGKFHEVAAPYKAYFNNKTKPALLQALKNAQAKTGTTPVDSMPAVAHLEKEHGLSSHQGQLGHADTESIHAALHALDPQGSDHTHAPASPGFISFDGTPFSPQAVAEGLAALQKAPKTETGVKKPLKSVDSPLSGLDLQGLVNNSSVTDSYKGSNGKVHYGKMKPALIAFLQDALDKHQTDNPPVSSPAAVIPDPVKSVGDIDATEAEILEMQGFFGSIDMDTSSNWKSKLSQLGHNPLALNVDWESLAAAKNGGPVPAHELNAALHAVLNDYLDKPTPLSSLPPAPTPPENVSPSLNLNGLETNVQDIHSLNVGAINVDSIDQISLGDNNSLKGVPTEQLAAAVAAEPTKAAITDALQESADVASFLNNNPPGDAGAPETISVGGASVTKQQLLDAVAAVKGSSSTSVKAPLKEINSPLAKVDLKTYVENDPVSDPFKGGNGKVHYGKLKSAVAAVLEAKAENMSAPGEKTAADAPDVTEVGKPSPSVAAPDVDDDPFAAFDQITTNVSSSSSSSVSNAWENAKNSTILNDGTFADAWQQSAKMDSPWYFSPSEDFVTESFNEVDGVDFYEIDSGKVSFIDPDGNKKSVSDAEVFDLLNGAFSSTPGLGEDLAGSKLAAAGVYTAAGGMTLKVFPDGTAQTVNHSSGQSVPFDDPDMVQTLVNAGSWTKVSDSVADSFPTVDGVEVGKYVLGGQNNVSVYPDGTAVINQANGSVAVSKAALVKDGLVSAGVSPFANDTDIPQWVKDAPKDPNGLLVGKYQTSSGVSSVTVDASGPVDSTPQALTALLLLNIMSPIKESDAPDIDLTPEQQSLLSALVNKAKNAPYQDAFAPTATKISQGFQQSVKTNKKLYSTGSGLSQGAPPQVQHYQFTPDGHVKSVAADGSVLKDFSPEQLVDMLDDSYDGPSVKNPPLPEPEDVSPMTPDGTWNGHAVGTWTNGEGAFLEITPDGPQLDDGDDGVDADMVEGMIESGILFLAPSPDLPASVTPSSSVDVDAPKLQPFMQLGHYTVEWAEKWQLTEAVKAWAKESGLEGKVGLHLGTAKKEDLANWLTHWSKGEWDKAYEIEAAKVKNHKAKLTHPGSPDNPVNASGFTQKKMPPLVDGELPAGQKPPGVFPDLSEYWAWDMDVVDSYMLAANMKNPQGLHNAQKRTWVKLHIEGNKIGVDSLSALGQKNVNNGSIYSDPILPSVEKYLPGQAIPMGADFPEIDVSKKSAKNLDNGQVDQYLNHLGTNKVSKFLQKQSLETKQELAALHAVSAAPDGVTTFKDPAVAKQELTDLLKKVQEELSWNENGLKEYIQALTKVEKKTFTMDALQPPLAGHSTLYHVTDESGNPYLFKVAQESFMADIEDAAMKLADLSGIKVAASELGKFNGKYGQFQAKVPSKSSLKGVDLSTLKLSALKDLMRAHTQDYLTANDDAHADNFLLSPDGASITPIDIAHAFKKFGVKGPAELDLDNGLSNWETPVYEKLYKDIADGKYADADVDELYRASIAQAKKTANVDPAAWEDVLRKGLKDRPNYGLTAYSNMEQMVAAALKKKAGLEQDFEKFWDGIYGKLGREKPAKAVGREKWIHTSVSDSFLQHAQNMGNQGASAFFGGADLQESHLLAQVVQNSGGTGQELHFSGQLLKSSDNKLKSWMQNNVTSDLSGASTPPPSGEQKFLDDAGTAGYFDTVVKAAKTISHHHSKGDKNYNTTHMAALEQMKADVDKKLADADSGNFPPAFQNWPEAQTEYQSILQHYKSQIDKVEFLKDNNGQSKVGDFEKYDLNVPPQPVLENPIEVAPGLKVTKINAYFDTAEFVPGGPLKLTGQTSSQGQDGQAYRVELSDGTLIEYRPHQGTNTDRSQRGELKVKVRNYDGTTNGWDSARAALSHMGLDLNDATEEDMELTYYRHLYAEMLDRNDANTGSRKEVADFVKANLPGGSAGTPALSAKEELERWRKAWSRLDPERFNTFLSGKQWMPKFHRSLDSSANGQIRGGNPFWERFDVDKEALKKKALLTHNLYSPSKALTIVQSNGLLSTEERWRKLGQWSGGMSSGEDQVNGGANFVFTRANLESFGAHVYIAPEVMLRTTNYSFNYDAWGKMDSRATASSFEFDKMTGNTGDTNELLIKRQVSLLDDIELLSFSNQALLDEALTYLRSIGVTTIRGLPIEDRLVMEQNKTAALAKIKKHRETWEGEEED